MADCDEFDIPGYKYFPPEGHEPTVQDMVKEFHKVFLGKEGFGRSVKDRDLVNLRIDLIEEEWLEFLTATGWAPKNQPELEQEPDPVAMLDAIVDIVYVAVGAAVSFGWDFDEAFRRVHESNMSKLGEDGKPIHREDGKVLKGENYHPPKLEDLV